MTYGLGPCGYDIRIGKIDRKVWIGESSVPYNDPSYPTVKAWTVRPNDFILLSSLERIRLPYDLVGYVRDKSTLARRGLALQNTVLEPGWEGYITLELSNHGADDVRIEEGMPIGQVMFELLDQPTNKPYTGKYQDQPNRPVKAIDNRDTDT